MLRRRVSVRQLLAIATLLGGGIYTFRSLTSESDNDWLSYYNRAPVRQAPSYYNNIFAFGDSLSETLFDPKYDMPTAENPFGNAWPGVTSSGGPNWIGYLFDSHLKSTMIYNLALGGAQVSSAEFGDEPPRQRDFQFQVDNFLKANAEEKVPSWEADSTLFSAWFGTNDVHGSFMRWKKYDLHDVILKSYFEQCQRLVDVGARNFLAMTPEPVHLTKFHRYGKGDGNELLRNATVDWNKKLRVYAHRFERKTKARVFLVDVMGLVEKAVQDEVAQPCTVMEEKGDKNECMWQDQFHLGIIPHRLIADEVFKTILS